MLTKHSFGLDRLIIMRLPTHASLHFLYFNEHGNHRKIVVLIYDETVTFYVVSMLRFGAVVEFSETGKAK